MPYMGWACICTFHYVRYRSSCWKRRRRRRRRLLILTYSNACCRGICRNNKSFNLFPLPFDLKTLKKSCLWNQTAKLCKNEGRSWIDRHYQMTCCNRRRNRLFRRLRRRLLVLRSAHPVAPTIASVQYSTVRVQCGGLKCYLICPRCSWPGNLSRLGSHNDRPYFQDSVKLLCCTETNP